MFKVAYVEKAYGMQGTCRFEESPKILQVRYYYGEPYQAKKDGFIRAEIWISRGKGSYGAHFVIEAGKPKPRYVKYPR